ncbi:MAG TPA: DUF4339 domain-containing protein [Pseudoxanthomonas sp.]|nr:DUF4339 domain-containing protein [Pseudoxanthomonas sp.]
MTHWYYITGDRQRQGPADAATVDQLFRSGRIHLDTLVWRDGQPQWRSLGELIAEVGLVDTAGGALPPPLPPVAPVQAEVSGPPRAGLSGCMIALIAGAVLAVPMIAILAAIALPAYNDYVLRARVSGMVVTIEPLRARLATHVDEHSECPRNGETGFGTPESYAHGKIASVTIGKFESGLRGMELRLTGTGDRRLDGKLLRPEYDPERWSWICSSEIDDSICGRSAPDERARLSR